jgi:uncharacterized protein (DUF362 family)/Pyruvate/2-oxoacid:ferredoxin oxidoreductase delta subunit
MCGSGNPYGNGSLMARNKHIDKARVSITRADGYDFIKIYEAVDKCLQLIGGLDGIIKRGDTVFVKINHLSPASPAERGIVTHPVFLQAILELLKKSGVNITVGDDIDSDARDGFSVSGIRQICQAAGVKLINLREAGFKETKCNGVLLDKAYLSRVALDADVIVNLPRLKTHSFAVFTGGIKNMFGTIPTGHRRKFHYEFRRNEDFSQMLTDVFSVIKPNLTVMDGIMAMEGEGPASGSLRKLGIVLASQDTVALDTIASRIIGLEPFDVLTTKYAYEKGLGIGDPQHIEVIGETIENVATSDFKLPLGKSGVLVNKVPSLLSGFLLNQTTVKPVVMERLCTGCSECERICPAAAISVAGEKATISQNICISCMCCHEVCRFNAIMPRRPVVGRFIMFVANILRRSR